MRTCVRARACAYARTLHLLHAPPRKPPPPATPFPPPSPPPSPCEQPAISCREPTRYTHLRTYPLRITVAMLCRDVLNESKLRFLMLHVMRKKMHKKKKIITGDRERREERRRNNFSSGQLQDRLKLELHTDIRAGV